MVCSVVTVYYVLRSKGVSSLIIIPLFATGAVDTGSKFGHRCPETRDCEYHRKFSLKNSK